MSISLQALESALSAIAEISHSEGSFKVGSTNLTVRTLSPEEEHEVQKYASQAWSESAEGEESEGNEGNEVLAYVDRFRIDTISRALVAIDAVDLRDVQYIETGEELPNGKPVKLPKHLALRGAVQKWGGPMRIAVFKKYAEVVRKAENQAEDAVEFEPSDLEAEIERLESRLKDLKQELEDSKIEQTNPVHNVVAHGDATRQMREEVPESPEPDEPSSEPSEVLGPYPGGAQQESQSTIPPQTAPQPGSRRPIIPQQAPPPQQAPAPQQQDPPAPTAPMTQVPPPQVSYSHTPSKYVPPTVQDSFVGQDDLEDAVATANQSLFDMHHAGQSLPPDPYAHRPPHRGAAEAASEIQEQERERVEKAKMVAQTPDGVPVFSLPAGEVDLGKRAAGPPINAPKPESEAINPRFRPPQGRPRGQFRPSKRNR